MFTRRNQPSASKYRSTFELPSHQVSIKKACVVAMAPHITQKPGMFLVPNDTGCVEKGFVIYPKSLSSNIDRSGPISVIKKEEM